GPGGTAQPDKDYYTYYNSPLSFAPGETSKTITAYVKPDTYRETDETFVVTLSGASNATISQGSATGTILDDDPTGPIEVNATTGGMARDYTGTGTFTEAVTGVSSVSIRKFNFVPGGGNPVDERAILEFNVGASAPLPGGPVDFTFWENSYTS